MQQKGFIRYGKAWFTQYQEQSENVVAFGWYESTYDESSYGARMYATFDDENGITLEIPMDVWPHFHDFAEVLMWLSVKRGECTEEKFVEQLQFLKYIDRTEYVNPDRRKSLGQIAYEGTPQGGRENFGPWANAPQLVKDIHEELAHIVADEVTQGLYSYQQSREKK